MSAFLPVNNTPPGGDAGICCSLVNAGQVEVDEEHMPASSVVPPGGAFAVPCCHAFQAHSAWWRCGHGAQHQAVLAAKPPRTLGRAGGLGRGGPVAPCQSRGRRTESHLIVQTAEEWHVGL